MLAKVRYAVKLFCSCSKKYCTYREISFSVIWFVKTVFHPFFQQSFTEVIKKKQVTKVLKRKGKLSLI